MKTFKEIRASFREYIWTLYFAQKDPRVNWKAKFVIYLTLAYALSPIDLIPDFIPIIGLLDDILILALGIYVAIKLTSATVWEDCNRQALEAIAKGESLSKNWWVATIIMLLWLFLIVLVGKWFWGIFWLHEMSS
jgi:uncharacterized membrane protein YkvA (DUF1232 family)